MSNLIEETNLLRQNKQDLVDALVEVGIPVTMETPLSKLAECLKWAAGFGGCPIAVIEKTTSKQKYIPAEVWTAMSTNQKSQYEPQGICLLAEGRALVIAKEDCLSPSGTPKMTWGGYDYDIPNLKNYSNAEPSVNFLDDFDGERKTDIICQTAVDRGIAYPAAQQARAYKAFVGDPFTYFLGDVSEWTLIDRYRSQVNDALRACVGLGLTNNKYWTSDEEGQVNAWHISSAGAVGKENYSKTEPGCSCCVRPFANPDLSAVVDSM